MSSRETILQAIRAHKPAGVPRPESPAITSSDPETLVAAFEAMVQAIGGRVERTSRAGAADAVARAYPDARVVASAVAGIAGTVRLEEVGDPHDLAGLDLMVLEGDLGVSENGAVWVYEHQMVHRAAPFIAQHLAIVLDAGRLVPDMHAAYAAVRTDIEGFGVFIAGPSKTADIEQSLVLGAHGPRSLLVVLV
ncbi:MAG: LUD domain-containing protein [Rhodothermales bacterium]|nr:LUD domain-containing protein [Rhodothermales bacterium]